jgi:hypothetical protein
MELYLCLTFYAFRDRIPVGTRFFAPAQTGPGTHPTSYTMGTVSLSPGVKRPGRGVNHPTPSSAEVKGRIELYLYSASGPSWPVLGRTVSRTRQVHNLFQSEFSTECDLVLPLSIYIILSFP